MIDKYQLYTNKKIAMVKNILQTILLSKVLFFLTSCNTGSQELHTQGIDSAGKVAKALVQKVLTAEVRGN